MRQKFIFSLAIFILMICFGCEKNSDDSSVDLAANSTGVYSGTWVIVGTGQVAGTCEVVKASGTSVNLVMTAGGQSIPTLPGVKLSDGGSGIIKISYTDSSGTLNGTIQNKSLSFTIKAGTITETFSGTKP
ncbi:MAG: hypothetical protein Q7U54_01265 [Bacteroidales bacterium]|nr:hypothetical protein [Bacteroidales bacterium]